jgi:hypothetical protein
MDTRFGCWRPVIQVQHKENGSAGPVRVFRQKVTLEDAVGSYTC